MTARKGLIYSFLLLLVITLSLNAISSSVHANKIKTELYAQKIVDNSKWDENFSELFRKNRFIYPVVFIHGYSASGENWNETKDMLTSKQFIFGGHFDFRGAVMGNLKKQTLENNNTKTLKGFKTADFYTLSFSRNNQLTFREQGAELKLVIDAVKSLNNTDKVILVGHSMGGLAARAYIQYPDLYQHDVHALVTMATPHLGSFWGKIADQVKNVKDGVFDNTRPVSPSGSQLLKEFDDYLLNSGVVAADLDYYRNNLVAFLSIFLAAKMDINISSEATRYLNPASKELVELNQLDFPQDIELVNVVSQWDMESLKEPIVKWLGRYEEIAKSVDKTISRGALWSNLLRFPLDPSKPQKPNFLSWYLDEKIKPDVHQKLAHFLYDQLDTSKISVTQLYEFLQCDFFNLCNTKNSPLNLFSNQLNIKASDGVVPLISQLIYMVPLSRTAPTPKDHELSRQLQEKTDVRITDLFHSDVYRKKTDDVTFGAIEKYAKKLAPYSHMIFVIDSSGSMGKTDTQNIRVSGPSILLNKINKESFVSVVDFDHRATTRVEHKSVKTELQTIKNGLASIDSKGNTHIGRGLSEGIRLAKKHPDQAVIFLLTDGQDNGKTDVLAIAQSVADTIPIFTIGLTGQVNELLLSKIADITKGKYFKAADSQHLFSKLNIMMSDMALETGLLNMVGRINQDDIQQFEVQIDKTVEKISVVLSWAGSRIALKLIRPDGTVLSPTSGKDSKASFFLDKNNVVAVMEPKQTGKWKLQLHGEQIPQGGEDFHLFVNAQSQFNPKTLIKNSYTPGEPVPLKVYVAKEEVSDITVKMVVETSAGDKIDVSNDLFYQAVAQGDYQLTTNISGHYKSGELFNRVVINEFHVQHDEKKSFHLPQIGMTMKFIKPGNFHMGRSSGPKNERPARNITLSKGFWMAESEVTQAMWKKIMGTNPSAFPSGGQYPVESVAYEESLLFLQKLSKLSGMQCRLPTEAEWEYACRAGSKTRFSWGDDILDDHVRNNDEWSLGHSPVKLFSPNKFGLFDMHSNVWEWCADWYDSKYYQTGPSTDPKGPAKGEYRVARGGAWCYGGEDMSSSKRTAIQPKRKLGNLGFRFVIDR